MKKGKKFIVILCIIIFIFFSSGLKTEEPIEELEIIAGVGLDINGGGLQRKYSIPMEVYRFSENNVVGSEVKNGTAYSIGETREERQRKENKENILGLEKVYLFSEDYSDYGIRTGADILINNPYLNDSGYIAVCKGKATDMLSYKVEGSNSCSDYIEGILKNLRYYNFFKDEYKIMDLFTTLDSEGQNLAVPYIENTQEGLMVTGISIFKKDKMITKLNMKDSKILNILRENNTRGMLTLQKDSKHYINYYAKCNHRIECYKNNGKYKFVVNLNFAGDIVSSPSNQSIQNDNSEVLKFEEEMQESVKKQCGDFIQVMKNNYKVDCLNLGKYAVAKYGRHTGTDWNNVVCNSEIDVKVKVKVQRMGKGGF